MTFIRSNWTIDNDGIYYSNIDATFTSDRTLDIAVSNSVDGTNINLIPQYVLVDNLTNTSSVEMTYPYKTVITPFQRVCLELSGLNSNFQFVGDGTISLKFSKVDLSSYNMSDDGSLQIPKDIIKPVVVSVTGGTLGAIGSINTNLKFVETKVNDYVIVIIKGTFTISLGQYNGLGLASILPAQVSLVAPGSPPVAVLGALITSGKPANAFVADMVVSFAAAPLAAHNHSVAVILLRNTIESISAVQAFDGCKITPASSTLSFKTYALNSVLHTTENLSCTGLDRMLISLISVPTANLVSAWQHNRVAMVEIFDQGGLSVAYLDDVPKGDIPSANCTLSAAIVTPIINAANILIIGENNV
jgi:hypothetical protein